MNWQPLESYPPEHWESLVCKKFPFLDLAKYRSGSIAHSESMRYARAYRYEKDIKEQARQLYIQPLTLDMFVNPEKPVYRKNSLKYSWADDKAFGTSREQAHEMHKKACQQAQDNVLFAGELHTLETRSGLDWWMT